MARTNTRERILDVTAELFRHYGYTGTGLKQIVAQANAPFGSLYHFFPGGKEQLGDEVIRRSGQLYYELFETILAAAPDPVQGVRDFFDGAAVVLRETDYADACPIATVALEVASRHEGLRAATAAVFDSWIDGGAGHLEGAGVESGRARELTMLLIALIEGAFVLCRARRTTDALEVAGTAAAAAVQGALTEVARR